MGDTRTRRRRHARLALAVMVGFGLVAASCGNKKDEGGAQTPEPATTAAAATATTAGSGAVDSSGTTVVETTASSAPAAQPTPGGSIVISGDAKVANPWTPAKMQCDAYCYVRARTFFDQVAVYGSDQKVHPYLAESITPNADATVWSVKLRPGLTFTDGTPIDADAVIYNLQATGTGVLVSAALADVARNADKSLKIEKTGDLSFDVYMGYNGDASKPTSWYTFDQTLTGQWGLIASPTWLKAVAAGTASETAPVGSGPYLLKSFSDDQMVVVRNPDYWMKDQWGQQLPYLDQITFRVIADPETAEQALRNGDTQGFATSNGGVNADFINDSAFSTLAMTKFGETDFLLLHLTTPVLKDQRVRCALAKAIDRQELVDAIGGGITQIANGVFSPGQQGYLEDNGFDPAQDIAGAKALIDEYVAETGQPVSIKYGTTAVGTNERRAELMKGYWEAIGVKVDVQMVEQSSFITNALVGIPDFQVYAWRQHAGVTVDSQWHWWSSRSMHPDGEISLNFARLSDPVVDENLDKVRQSADPEAREAAAEAINREFAKECWEIPLNFAYWGLPHSKKLQGFGTAPIPDAPGVSRVDSAGAYWTTALWLEK